MTLEASPAAANTSCVSRARGCIQNLAFALALRAVHFTISYPRTVAGWGVRVLGLPLACAAEVLVHIGLVYVHPSAAHLLFELPKDVRKGMMLRAKHHKVFHRLIAQVTIMLVVYLERAIASALSFLGALLTVMSKRLLSL
jgi:hypothetical protein